MFMKLALKSLMDRKGSVILSLMAMTVSVFVLLGVEHIRHQAKESFSNTVSGVDLIVGARTGNLNLLLYSVFRVGNPTNNIRWKTYETIANDRNVKWAIPISLGDSHKGYRVLGTNADYFKYFSYGQKRNLEFEKGKAFNEFFEVVLGSEVASKLGYQLGDKLVLAHGIGATSFSMHDKYPFTVVGILKPTGTPVDQTLHVSLEGIESIHADWNHGSEKEGSEEHQADLKPKSITAIMLGLKSKLATFQVQRAINEYEKEPLIAILPGVTLTELWQMMSILEATLLLVAVLVFIAASLGVSAMLLSSIRERNREIKLLRIIGAPPYYLFFLIQLEALLITLLSCVLGTILLGICLKFLRSYLETSFGLYIETNLFTNNSLYLIGALVLASIIVAVIPSLSGYRSAVNVKD